MHVMHRTFVVLALAGLLLLSGCGGSGPTKGDVTVYVAAPLSGFQANGGQTIVGGARLRAHEINEAGGLLGYRVQVVGVDDESDSDVAVDVANSIADAVLGRDERVIGILSTMDLLKVVAEG